jgi:hypothetical protein
MLADKSKALGTCLATGSTCQHGACSEHVLALEMLLATTSSLAIPPCQQNNKFCRKESNSFESRLLLASLTNRG